MEIHALKTLKGARRSYRSLANNISWGANHKYVAALNKLVLKSVGTFNAYHFHAKRISLLANLKCVGTRHSNSVHEAVELLEAFIISGSVNKTELTRASMEINLQRTKAKYCNIMRIACPQQQGVLGFS
jgi:hypothetical protein